MLPSTFYHPRLNLAERARPRHLVSLSNLYAHRLESIIPSKTLGSLSCSSCAICTSQGLHFQEAW